MPEELDEEVEQEVVRVTRLLDHLIRISGTTKLALEKKMGWSAGYLSRLANGSIELRLRHVLLVTKALDVSPAAFFHAVYPHVPQDESGPAGILTLLQGQQPGAAPAAAPMSEEEFDTRLASAVVRIFGRLIPPEGSGGKGSGGS